jgi:hypothetical protein
MKNSLQSYLKHLTWALTLLVLLITLSSNAKYLPPPCTTSMFYPYGLFADQITLGSARLRYSYSGPAPYATLYWRVTGTTYWNSKSGTGLNICTIYNLQPSTMYEWKVVRCCGPASGPCSGSSPSYFTTLSCSIVTIDTSVTVNGNTLIANDSVAKYQWFDCNVMSFAGNDTNQSFSPLYTGIFAVSISKGLCSDTSLCIPVTVTGIHENYSSNHFSIYSFNKIIHINFNKAGVMNGFSTVHNNLGQELRKIRIESSDLQIDMSDYSSGIYFVSVQTDDAIESRSIYIH